MVTLRVEELESRCLLSGSDALGNLISQLQAGSHTAFQFFENLNAWIYLSLMPQTTPQESRPSDPDSILASLWGACSDRNYLMQQAAARLGYQAESVPFYNVPYQGNHVATEIDIGGKWCFFDSTTGIYFTTPGGSTPLSFSAATQRFPNVEIRQATGNFWLGGWHYATHYSYAPLQQNILTWHGSPVFNVDATYFPGQVGSVDRTRQVSGHFTGHGLTEVASYSSATHEWYVSVPQPHGHVKVSAWGRFSPATHWSTVLTGDFTGNGRDDLAIYYAPTQTWFVGVSTAANTFSFRPWLKMPAGKWNTPLAGDFTGNGSDDLAFYNQTTGAWSVAVPQGNKFSLENWGSSGLRGWGPARVGDFTDDGRDDLMLFRRTDRTFWVALSDGNHFTFQQWAAPGLKGWGAIRVGDFTGDGLDDLAAFNQTSGTWWVAVSSGSQFTFQPWGVPRLGSPSSVLVGDFNGDGLADVAVYQLATRKWWIGHSTGNAFDFEQIGGPVSLYDWSLATVGDLTGDGVDDFGIYHAFNDLWWIAP